MRQRGVPGSIGVAKTRPLASLTRREGSIMEIAWRIGGDIGRLRMGRITGTIIGRTRIIMLTPIGRLLPLVIIPPIGIPVLVPLAALRTIPAVGIVMRLIPLTVMPIPAVSIATRLLIVMRRPIPAVGMALRLMPLTVLAIPAVGMARRPLIVMRLPVPDVGMATRLGRGESLTIPLRGKRTIRSGLGAQRAQSHKQTQRENNAPPSC